MNRVVFAAAVAAGLAVVAWVGWGFLGSHAVALAMTGLIGAVYLAGVLEIQRFRAATAALAAALADVPQPLAALDAWLTRLPPALQMPVRARIEGERVALPGPTLAPYLVGLLVMLGMLGTFLGMVVTFQGAVLALQGSADLQAIRAALAAPIQGLGLSFGTSVAGVAASAMLGLVTALGRRERLEAVRQLDACVATVFRPFSLGHQRQTTYLALQTQALALPDLVERMHTLVAGLEHRSQHLSEQLLGQQQGFHERMDTVYTDLAQGVGRALQDSLAAGATAAGASLRPVVQAAMAYIAAESARQHQRQVDATQAQLTGLAERHQASTDALAQAWLQAGERQAQGSTRLLDGLAQRLDAQAQAQETRSAALLAAVQDGAARAQAEQAQAEQQRLAAWGQALEAMGHDLHTGWQTLGAQQLAQQQAVCQTLERTAADLTERNQQQAEQTLARLTQLLDRSDALVQARTDAEATWLHSHSQRLDGLLDVWRTELAALRDVEAERSQAAANVLAQLRQDSTRLAERDLQVLQERTVLVGQLQGLLDTAQRTTAQQQAAIEALVASSGAVLQQAGAQWTQTLQAQAQQSAEAAAHTQASAIELASLGAAFQHGVQRFQASSEQLVDSLQRIEAALQQSLARSDDQLAYYVAQAREVIDLSIASQQGILDDLHRLRREPTAWTEGAAA